MRTKLTLDGDAVAKLKIEVRRTGKSFKEAADDFLRLGLNVSRSAPTTAFRIQARDRGQLRPGLSPDNVGELLEIAESPGHP